MRVPWRTGIIALCAGVLAWAWFEGGAEHPRPAASAVPAVAPPAAPREPVVPAALRDVFDEIRPDLAPRPDPRRPRQ